MKKFIYKVSKCRIDGAWVVYNSLEDRQIGHHQKRSDAREQAKLLNGMAHVVEDGGRLAIAS